MYLFYNLILSPIFFILYPFLYLFLDSKNRERMKPYFNFEPKFEKTIWFHCASVGEFLGIKEIVNDLSSDYNIVLTLNTLSGLERAEAELSESENIEIRLSPIDIFPVTNIFFNTVNPDLIVTSETELWFLRSHIASDKGIKNILINGRIGKSKLPKYKKYSFFYCRILEKFDFIAAQSEADAERFREIGCRANIQVLGNSKYDISSLEEKASLNEYSMYSEIPIVNIASTHEGEEELILRILGENIKKGDFKVIIAPRHLKRLNEVKSIIEGLGLTYKFRSSIKGKDLSFKEEVLIIDTIGELFNIFSISDAVILGGSFVNKGGHNILEPLIWKKPVINGKYIWNIEALTQVFQITGCVKVLEDYTDLSNCISEFLSNKIDFTETERCINSDFKDLNKRYSSLIRKFI